MFLKISQDSEVDKLSEYKKVIGLMEDQLGAKILIEFMNLDQKKDSYLMDDGREDKKAKGTKKCVIKRRLKFEDWKKMFIN